MLKFWHKQLEQSMDMSRQSPSLWPPWIQQQSFVIGLLTWWKLPNSWYMLDPGQNAWCAYKGLIFLKFWPWIRIPHQISCFLWPQWHFPAMIFACLECLLAWIFSAGFWRDSWISDPRFEVFFWNLSEQKVNKSLVMVMVFLSYGCCSICRVHLWNQ
jgi:hypothetical protein